MTQIPKLHSLSVGQPSQNTRVTNLNANWSQDSEWIADFPNQSGTLAFDKIASVFINNEASSASVTVTVEGSFFTFTVQAGQVGTFPIYSNGLSRIILTSDVDTGWTFFTFANFAQSYFAYDASQISQAVKDTSLAASLTTNPAPNKPAIRTYDPAVEAAIKAMSAATGLDFNFDDEGNARTVDANLATAISSGTVNVAWADPQSVNINGVQINHGALNTYPTDGNGHPFVMAYDLTNKGPSYGDPRTSYAFIPDAQNNMSAPDGWTWSDAFGNFKTLMGVFDPRLKFDENGQLITSLSDVSIDGGAITVNTKDKYDDDGNLLVSLNADAVPLDVEDLRMNFSEAGELHVVDSGTNTTLSKLQFDESGSLNVAVESLGNFINMLTGRQDTLAGKVDTLNSNISKLPVALKTSGQVYGQQASKNAQIYGFNIAPNNVTRIRVSNTGEELTWIFVWNKPVTLANAATTSPVLILPHDGTIKRVEEYDYSNAPLNFSPNLYFGISTAPVWSQYTEDQYQVFQIETAS